MRKLMLLFVMLVAMILSSQGQQAVPSTIGLKAPQNNYLPSDNRSIPPGTLVWSQLPDCPNGNFYSSQLDAGNGINFQVADDFIFTTYPGEITAVKWWIGWFNPAEYVAPSSFNIYIYNNVGCLPGSVVAQWNIPFANANEDGTCIIDWPARSYWAALNPPFVPVVNQHYWFVAQPVMVLPPQTGMAVSSPIHLCSGAQQFYAPFVPLENDFAFELYATPPVPIGNWALLLGGILIAGAIFFRFRRPS